MQKSIIEIKSFVPHPYEEEREGNNIVPQAKYQQAVDWYSQVKDVEFFTVRYLSDGLQIVGILAKPKHKTPKLPLVIYNRGGHGDDGKINVRSLQRDFYYLAQHGYVVFGSQYRGNDGGQGSDELAGSDINDVLNLMSVATELGYIDTKNVFMVGFSRGVMQACRALQQGMPIKAAALISGVYDMFYFDEDRPDMQAELHQAFPVNRDEEYTKRSALRWAHDINTPLLIFHGEQDFVVNIREAKEFIEKLKQYGKTYEAVFYSDGDHYLNKQRTDINQKILAWFATWRVS